jgi:glutathione S-transferase
LTQRTLVIGNKKYSSWSLRPWLALRMAAIPFDELVVPLYVPATRAAILRHSPAGRVPILEDGDRVVFDSLAICEYAAELAPQARLWPADPDARAHARSISAEMHAGFSALRSALPMNLAWTGRRLATAPSAEVQADVERLGAILADARERFGAGGPFFFGGFTIADAMFAPIATRFRTYSIPLPKPARAWSDAVLALPPFLEWERAGRAESYVHAPYEALLAPA